MRRVVGDALISAAALLILLIALVSIDGRVRDTVTGMFRNGSVSSEASTVATAVGETASVILLAAREQSIEHAPLMIFVVAATTLVAAMMRL